MLSYPPHFTLRLLLQEDKSKYQTIFHAEILQVWLCIVFSSIVAGVATAFLEWHSPFGLNPRGRKRTKNYSLGSGLLMVMVLLTGHTINIKVSVSTVVYVTVINSLTQRLKSRPSGDYCPYNMGNNPVWK